MKRQAAKIEYPFDSKQFLFVWARLVLKLSRRDLKQSKNLCAARRTTVDSV